MMRTAAVLFSLVLALSALGDSADLDVRSSPGPGGFYRVTVTNAGPDVAVNVQVFLVVPGEVALHPILIPGCDNFSPTVHCRAATLNVDETLTYEFTLEGSNRDASYLINIHAASDTNDPVPSNNSITFTFTTIHHAHIATSITPEIARVDPFLNATFTAKLASYGETTVDNLEAIFTTDGAIESIEPASTSSITCTIAEDRKSARCTAASFVGIGTTGEMLVTLRGSDDLNGAVAKLSLRAKADLPDPFPADISTATLEVYRELTVWNTEDAGEGSLRNAIETANAVCASHPCKIRFGLPSDQRTVTPLTPLPAITADRVFVDGGGNTRIDGRLAHEGLRIFSPCDSVVQGLTLGNFDADQALWFSTSGPCAAPESVDERVVRNNFIGVDAQGNPMPNLRGIRADGADGMLVLNEIRYNTHSGVWMWGGRLVLEGNRIAQNGSSGVFLGPETTRAVFWLNEIRDQPQMGIAIARGARGIQITQNSMRNNGGLGIDWGLDARDLTGDAIGPTLVSAIYDAATNQTRVTFIAPDSVDDGWFDFYSNDSADGEGEQWMGNAFVFRSAARTQTLTFPGDLRGKWITTTWIATAGTSEMSAAVKVE